MIWNKYLYIMSLIVSVVTISVYIGNTLFHSPIFWFLQIVFWSIFILFLPGYYLTLSFFSPEEIDSLERFALSFALSISIIPLLTFYGNLLWMPINFYSIFSIVIVIIVWNIWFLKYRACHAK